MQSLPPIAALSNASPSAHANTADARSADRDFGTHLHAARQPRDASSDASDEASTTNATKPGASTPLNPDSAKPTTNDNAKPDPDKTDHRDDAATSPADSAATLVGAMLTLLGQAPAAAASRAVAGASKVLAASTLKTASAQNPLDAAATAPPGDADVLAAAQTGTRNTPTDSALSAAINAASKDLAFAAISKEPSKPDAALSDLAALNPNVAAPAQTPLAAPAHILQIPSPAGSTGFAQELGQHIAWLGGQEIKEARIRLHPEDLGQLDLKVSVQHNHQVDVTFAVQHPHAVHALQQTLSQLDAMLAQHGLSLGQADVGQRQNNEQRDSQRGSSTPSADEVAGVASSVSNVAPALGLLDAFA